MTASRTWNLQEPNGDNSLWPEEYDKVVLRVVSFLHWPLTQSSDGSKNQLSQGTPTTWNLCSLHNALTLTISLLHHSFREVMFALAPAFRSIDCIAGLNLNYRKCCWVQYGTEEHDSLRTWISENCEEFREMQIVRHSKYVPMIGSNGHLCFWTAHLKNHSTRDENQCFYQKSG